MPPKDLLAPTPVDLLAPSPVENSGLPAFDRDAYLRELAGEQTGLDDPYLKSILPKQEEPSVVGSILKPFGEFAQSVTSGATAGFDDEIIAKGAELTGRGTYEDNQRRLEAQKEAIPGYISVPGEIVGATAGIAAAAPAYAAVKAAPYVSTAFKAASKIPAWIKASPVGAAFGGLFGAGNAPQDQKLEGAKQGAGVGAVLGPAAYGTIRGGQKFINKLKDVKEIALNPRGATIRKIGEKLNEDQVTTNQIRSGLREYGGQGQAMIADTVGENTRGLIRGATKPPGRAKTIAFNRFKQRGEAETDYLEKTINKSLGSEEYVAAEAQFLDQLFVNGKGAYTPAYQAYPVIPMTMRLKMVLGDPIVRAGINQAVKDAATFRRAGEAAYLGPVDAELTLAAKIARESGLMEPVAGSNSAVASGFSLETWDVIKRGIDTVLRGPKFTNSITGESTALARAPKALRKSIVNELDRLTGGEKGLYATARKTWAGDLETLEALRAGAKFMKSRPAQIAKDLSEMSEASAQAYRTGAANHLIETMSKAGDEASAAKKLFGRVFERTRIRALFPDQQSYNEFARVMESWKTFHITAKESLKGAAPPPMATEMEAIEKMAGRGGAIAGSSGIMPVGSPLVLSGIGRQVARKAVQDVAPQDMVNQMIVRALLSRNRAMNLKVLDEIDKATAKGLINRDPVQKAEAMRKALGVTGPVSGTAAPNPPPMGN